MNKTIRGLTLGIVFLGMFLSFTIFDSNVEASLDELEPIVTNEEIENMDISFELNKTTMGKKNGILGELTFTNTGIDPFSNIDVDFSLSNNYSQFTDTYSKTQAFSLLNPSESETLNIEMELNQTGLENERKADVVLVFDSSSSMQDEIDQVKSEFLEMTDRLQNDISSLRMGMVVYGWNKYDPYPVTTRNNYIELTEDISEVNDLIEELYASGGTEPWGDAFWLVNTWDWREDATKLVIIVGDEDCDPGNIIGIGTSADYYNGSQLLDIVTSLKSKGIMIYSVLTGLHGIVENQFNWIADYTGGECVNLEDLQNGEDPITIPDLIEEWTLELSREYFVQLNATISCTELTAGGNVDHETTIIQCYLIDLASPSIVVSSLINEESGKYSVEITVKPTDISGIEQVNFYWTTDDIKKPIEPSWHFKIMTNKIGDYYIETISDLEEGDTLSFYIEATDSVFNSGKTQIYNYTIKITPMTFGEVKELLFVEDNTERTLYFNFTDVSYYFQDYVNITIGYLWIEAEQNLTITSSIMTGITREILIEKDNYSIFKYQRLLDYDNFSIVIEGDVSETPIIIRWEFLIDDFIDGFDNHYFYLHENERTMLLEVNLESEESKNYLVLLSPSDLIASLTIFDEEWNKIKTIGTFDPYELDEGHYYLWINHDYRFGEFEIYYGPERITSPDDYYVYGATNFSTIMVLLSIISIFLVQRFSRKRKYYEV